MHSLVRGLAALSGTAVLGLGAALAGAPTAAHAAPTTTTASSVDQIAAQCQTTTSGRACVALQLVDGDSAQSHYQAAFSLTPNSGQYMKPVGWTTINPNFAGTNHVFNGPALGRAWVQTVGSMSQASVIGFTFNVPGHTYHLYAGNGVGTSQSLRGPAHLYLTTTYYAKSNVVYARYDGRFEIKDATEPAYTPEYVRVFTRQNSTLYAKQLCPTGGCQPTGRYGIDIGLSYRADSISRPVGIAALVTIKGTPTTLVAKTAA